MNNLLFTALLIALLYYFFYYLPSHKKLNANPPLQHNQETQTETIISHQELQCPSAQMAPDEIKKLEKDIKQKDRTIIGLNNSYNKLETKTEQEIANLKKQLTEKEKQLQEKDKKLQELSAVETSLDQMIKNIQDLNQNLD